VTDPIRVLHLLKGLGPGGAERLVVTQATAAAAGSHRVAYLVPHKNHLVPLLDEAGVASVCLDGEGLARPGWIRRLRRLLITEPVDVVHVHSPAVASVARILIRTLPGTRRPVLVGTEHNRWPRHHRLTRLANQLTIRLETATIAVSADVAGTIRGTRAEKIRVVVHGIDSDAVRSAADRDAVRSELEIDDSDIVVMCVANLRREKALDILVEAAREALAVEPRLRYFLVGQGPLEADVDGWIDQAGVRTRFTPLGYRDDAPRLLSGADIFTLSSAHEGLPVAIMEALTLGLPIVATSVGGVADAAGAAGLISPIGDAAALAANHVRVATDPELHARLAGAAPIEAERFSIARAVKEIDGVYESALRSR
jgi:glycosyltransferase involved in cell wall biosynthesis